MGDSENVAMVRRFVDAFNRVDIDSALSDLHPEVELDEWRDAPGAGTYHGPDGVRRALDTWAETWEWMQVEIEDIAETGNDRVLFTLFQRAKGSGSGIEVEIRSVNVYTFREGKVRRIQLFTEKEPALEAAGLTPNYEKEKR